MRHFGVSRLLLLGYDMKPGHWHGNHPGALNKQAPFHDWLKRFRDAAPELEMEVINCTPGSALDAFPRMSLENALDYARRD